MFTREYNDNYWNEDALVGKESGANSAWITLSSALVTGRNGNISEMHLGPGQITTI